MLVNVLERHAFGEHEYLQVVEQLGDFFGAFGLGLVFGGHPDFGGFFDNLLADAVNARFQFSYRAGTGGAVLRFLAQLCKEVFEGFHILKATL